MVNGLSPLQQMSNPRPWFNHGKSALASPITVSDRGCAVFLIVIRETWSFSALRTWNGRRKDVPPRNRQPARRIEIALFISQLWVNVVAYIDESGTHDRTGQERGSSVAVIAGLVDRREGWSDFCKQWQSALDKYSAPYFHFCEWSTASLVVRGKITPGSGFSKNPFATWPLQRLDDFLYELAEIAGSGNRVTVGGWIETANIHGVNVQNAVPPAFYAAAENPYGWALNRFFQQLPNDILSGWPDWNEPVSIVFDQSDDAEWNNSTTTAHRHLREKDSRFSELAFADKKLPPHLPLQAADMIAYRYRQLAENFQSERLQFEPLPTLDRFIMKAMFDQFRLHGPGNIPPLM
jgi:uncharacterized protein DUF3800